MKALCYDVCLSPVSGRPRPRPVARRCPCVRSVGYTSCAGHFTLSLLPLARLWDRRLLYAPCESRIPGASFHLPGVGLKCPFT
eukprot:scaffold193977_cov26-Tisochrysis_lutea.AAC.1